jgi:hypothetical protein
MTLSLLWPPAKIPDRPVWLAVHEAAHAVAAWASACTTPQKQQLCRVAAFERNPTGHAQAFEQRFRAALAALPPASIDRHRELVIALISVAEAGGCAERQVRPLEDFCGVPIDPVRDDAAARALVWARVNRDAALRERRFEITSACASGVGRRWGVTVLAARALLAGEALSIEVLDRLARERPQERRVQRDEDVEAEAA